MEKEPELPEQLQNLEHAPFLCPHCKQPLDNIAHAVMRTGIVVFFCGACKVTLSVGLVPMPVQQRVQTPNLVIPPFRKN